MAGQAEAAGRTLGTIADERLRRLVDVVAAALDPEEIWLFGSRARGDAHEHSDYDLFVVVPDDTPREKIGLASTHELARNLIGTMCYTVAHDGVAIYDGRHGWRPNGNPRPVTSGGEGGR